MLGYVRFPLLVCIFTTLMVDRAYGDQKDVRLPQLFDRLRAAATPGEAFLFEYLIREIWLEVQDPSTYELLNHAMTAMSEQDLLLALDHFDQIVNEAPEFAEGWNKRAAVHFLMGDFDASVSGIQQTLALEPRHFDALFMLGVIYDRLDMPAAALRCFEAALVIHPHLRHTKYRVDELREQLAGDTT